MLQETYCPKGAFAMIILITGASHTGKTYLAQKMLEKYQYPCLSIDHLKMGLIRSGNTDLTPLSDDSKLTAYLWPIVCEIIKTAIENKQNLIIEGCYIPIDWQESFESEYLKDISCYCLVMSEKYIRNHFDDILRYADVIEKRLDDDCDIDSLVEDNLHYRSFSKNSNTKLIIIDDEYRFEGVT